ncbi:MAG: sigma-70 family RNA polymerase sigma factor [Verrucomicrobiota bacterium]|nr:sigma-70 family RNA polymerase sigma factor [Limisphaera sp.]MDW8382187.1 sigma-70 family RNA polymerase sigma factor [Verrucomicrobiota bacterium]
MFPNVGTVTELLQAMQRGEPDAADRLLALVYRELREMAALLMARESPGHTLQPTALVHEAWLRMTGRSLEPLSGRAHFFGIAAEVMRRILVESARRRRALKRGGGAEHIELQESSAVQWGTSEEVLAVHEALDQLAAEDPMSAELVKLRYFAGFTMEEAAAVLGLSVRTAERRWAYARAWLRRRIRPED